MANSKWIVKFSFLLGVLCNCQRRELVNLEETSVISCPSDNFVAVTADIVRVQAGEPDKDICLDPNYMPNTFPFYYTVSCESQKRTLTRQLMMYRDDIQLFQDLGGKFCLEERNSSDGNEQLLLGMNLADISREKRNFSLKLVCRAVGTSGSGGSDVETSALIEPRNTTSLRFIPQGQNGTVTTEKGKRVKIAALVALPNELENVNTSWSDSRITCGLDADVEVPKCVYNSQVGIQVTWSCFITTNKSDEYTFQHRGKLYVVRLTVHDSNSTDPSPSPPPPQDLTTLTVVLPVIVIFIAIGLGIGVIIAVVCYCRQWNRRLKDVQDNVQDTNLQLARQHVENGGLDTQSEPSHDSTPLESPNQPSSDAPELTGPESRNPPEKCDVSSDVNSDAIPDVYLDAITDVNSDANADNHRCSITDSNIDEAAIRNNGHTHMTDDRGSTELHIRSQNEDKPRPSGTGLHIPVQNGHIPTSMA